MSRNKRSKWTLGLVVAAVLGIGLLVIGNWDSISDGVQDLFETEEEATTSETASIDVNNFVVEI